MNSAYPQDHFEDLYDHLHAHACKVMRGKQPDHTLQATAVLHEAFLRIRRHMEPREVSRDHFLALAAKAMRCVLVDHARKRGREKRRSAGERLELEDIADTYERRAVDLVALDEALERLVEMDPLMAKAVELRFFAGLKLEECARVLELSLRTFQRRWEFTRVWLHEQVI